MSQRRRMGDEFAQEIIQFRSTPAIHTFDPARELFRFRARFRFALDKVDFFRFTQCLPPNAASNVRADLLLADLGCLSKFRSSIRTLSIMKSAGIGLACQLIIRVK